MGTSGAKRELDSREAITNEENYGQELQFTPSIGHFSKNKKSLQKFWVALGTMHFRSRSQQFRITALGVYHQNHTGHQKSRTKQWTFIVN